MSLETLRYLTLFSIVIPIKVEELEIHQDLIRLFDFEIIDIASSRVSNMGIRFIKVKN